MRTEADHVDGSALFNRTADVARRNVPRCGHFQRIGHTEDRCWDLHPERRPAHYSGRSNRGTNGKSSKSTSIAADKTGTALAANVSGTAQPSDTPKDRTDFVCLMAKAKVSPSISRYDQSVSSASSLTWHIDSGASAHMTFDRSAFSSYTKVDPFSLELGDKSTSVVAGRGDVGINVKVNGGQRLCMLQDVLHISDFAYSLVSVSALVERDITVSFDKVGVPISRNTCLLVSGSTAGKLFVLDAVRPPSERSLVANLDLWHLRLGHVKRAGILQMARRNVAKGLHIATQQRGTDTHNGNLCSGCMMGKLTRTEIPNSSGSAPVESTLDVVVSDVAGPIEPPSLGGAQFFVTFIDKKSKWTEAVPIRSKSETFEKFRKFKAEAEVHAERKVKEFGSDCGGEYTSNAFESFLVQSGIHHRLTCAYTPQQNGLAERMNRTLMYMVRTMLHHANMPAAYWAEALKTAVYIRNRVTSRTLPRNKTPYHFWNKTKPDLAHLRVFGSECWYKVTKVQLRKPDARGRPALMIGYASNQKGYKLWDTEDGKVVVSRDVAFDETRRKIPESASPPAGASDNTSSISVEWAAQPECNHFVENNNSTSDREAANTNISQGESSDDTEGNDTTSEEEQQESATNMEPDAETTETSTDVLEIWVYASMRSHAVWWYVVYGK